MARAPKLHTNPKAPRQFVVGTLPSREAVLKAMAENPSLDGKRDLARYFGIHGDMRTPFKVMLKEMEGEGFIARTRKQIRPTAALPAVTVLDIPADADPDDLHAYPAQWNDEEGAPPRVIVHQPKAARVVPMLPERISNDLCSLREGENRPSLAVRMVFDKQGRKRSHSFHRVLFRSAAKLNYQQAQAAIDGKPDDKTGPILQTILRPLWAAYATMARARDQRGPLDLDLPERKIILDKAGMVVDVKVPERLDAHRLIEEMMIAANVAAAETLEKHRSALLYRVHDTPSQEKLVALRDFLASLSLPAPRPDAVRPADFNRILDKARSDGKIQQVSEIILRTQAQAEYASENYGHFGLNLDRYAHFTSPIRRYADLIVHRALIAALDLGEDGLTENEIAKLPGIAQHISSTERRAMLAERETVDRLLAQFLAEHVNARFEGRISGVTKSGLFVRLKETGADGFIPASTLGADYYRFVEAMQAMVGDRTGETFRIGDDVEVRLLEVAPIAGALRFELLSEGSRGVPSSGMRRRKGPFTPRGKAGASRKPAGRKR